MNISSVCNRLDFVLPVCATDFFSLSQSKVKRKDGNEKLAFPQAIVELFEIISKLLCSAPVF